LPLLACWERLKSFAWESANIIPGWTHLGRTNQQDLETWTCKLRKETYWTIFLNESKLKNVTTWGWGETCISVLNGP
jgi:hypothetical protein